MAVREPLELQPAVVSTYAGWTLSQYSNTYQRDFAYLYFYGAV
jgi:hypothetical protein